MIVALPRALAMALSLTSPSGFSPPPATKKVPKSMTTFGDRRIDPYWEAAKYVERLREIKTVSNVLFIKSILAAGHGGDSGHYGGFRELALTYTFVLDQFGLDR